MEPFWVKRVAVQDSRVCGQPRGREREALSPESQQGNADKREDAKELNGRRQGREKETRTLNLIQDTWINRCEG
jgi:hypothetical protein